jgi:hypothetical protein
MVQLAHGAALERHMSLKIAATSPCEKTHTMMEDPLTLANAAYVDEDFDAALQHYTNVSSRS